MLPACRSPPFSLSLSFFHLPSLVLPSFPSFRFSSLILFFLSFYFLSIITYGIAVPSGLFVPAIVNGAIYGRICGMLMTRMLSSNRVDEGTFSLLGAASFLGGSMRMTVSLCIILLELTGSLELLPLIMLVLLVSKSVGDALNEGIYDAHVRLKGMPYLEAHPEQSMRNHEAKDAIRSAPVTLAGVERVGHIVRTLQAKRHNAFPVISYQEDGSASFAGMILRGHLLVLLQSKRCFQPTPERAVEHAGQHDAGEDFGKPGSGKGLRIEDIAVSEEESAMFIDLHPFANRSTYLVPENMTVSKVYTLFRQLGLRHLCVVPKPSEILGVITRKDLLPQTFTERNVARAEDI